MDNNWKGQRWDCAFFAVFNRTFNTMSWSLQTYSAKLVFEEVYCFVEVIYWTGLFF